MFTFRLADTSFLVEMIDLINACRQDLIARGLFQWDESYPNGEYLQSEIEDGHAHIFQVDGLLAGLVVLNPWQHPSWQQIDWEAAGSKPLVIHSLALHPDFQGRRLGSAALKTCEDWARAHGFDTIRLDVFAENQIAVRLYQRHGYRLQGTIVVASKPPCHQLYDCYQKAI
jgi:ribosomal protein S18 acetylase RimI-like enzyme